MFSRRVFGGNPDSFKLVLEYGKDSLVEQAATLPGGQVRLPVALATLEFEFNSDESEATILERFTQAKSRIAFDRLEERVVLKLTQRDDARKVIAAKLSIACITPALRCVQVVRTSSAGTAPEALLTALFKHCDLSGVWKLRGADGFGNFWCSCCEVQSWRSLANINLSACGLTALPPSLGSLPSLRILRLSHNRLTALPAEVSALTALEVLAADHNQLTAIPAELRRCSSLRHLELEGNRLVTPVLDLRALCNLVSLQLYGNPLEYLPELSPATALRSLSLANVRIMADAGYTRWEVEVAALPYISRGHKLAPLFKLTFRRSSCQHPLLAGALGRISEDRSNCEMMAREETAIQQLVLMALSEQPVVAEQACRTLGALAQLGLATARKLLAHDVLSTIVTLLRSPRRVSKLCGLNLLGSLAAASEAVSAELMTVELLHMLQSCIEATDPDPRVTALTALANLAFCRDNKLKIRAAAGLLSTLMDLAMSQVAPAASADAVASRSPPNTAKLPEKGFQGGQQPQQPQLEEQRQMDGISLMRRGRDQPAGSSAVAPGAVRMPLRAGAGPRYSDTGGAAIMAATGLPPAFASSSQVLSSPDSTTAAHGMSVSAGGALGAAAGLQLASPQASRSTTTTLPGTMTFGSPRAAGDALSPPHHPRALHHSASTPASVGSLGGGGSSSGGALAAAAARTLSPLRTNGGTTTAAAAAAPPPATVVLSPTPPHAETGATAAAPSGLPPQISLAPPREVPEHVATRDQARMLAIKVLAILGENEHVRRAVGEPPITGRGIRVLALDGGGMRGLALVQMMRHIERRAGRPLHQLFDLVVGTSTGAIVAVGLGVFHYSLDQCESIYTGLGHKVFNQAGASSGGNAPSPREELLAAAQAQAAAQLAGNVSASTAASTGWRDSLFRVVRGTSTNLRVAVYGFKHDATTFEELLRQMCDVKKLGCVGNQLIDAAPLGGPKVAAVATLVSCCPVTPFLFTSYELPPEVAPAAAAMHACPSSSKHQLWQAVRASSAAPYYLDDFVCGEERYQDGAATANNPSILALQQARLLWPGVQLDALVSLGCGAAPTVRRERGAHAVLDTGVVLVDAATSPDRADEALSTLLPMVPGVKYFRFQPVHERCSMELDDVNPQHWAALQAAVDEYCSAHSARIGELAELLLSGQGGGGAAGGSGEEEAAPEEEEEDEFELPAGTGPEGVPLPPVPRVRLGSRRGLVIVEAPAGGGVSAAQATTNNGGGGDDTRPLPEQAVVQALSRQPHTLRRCDIAAAAADAAASAALAEEHMKRLGRPQEPQQGPAGSLVLLGALSVAAPPSAMASAAQAIASANAAPPAHGASGTAGGLVSPTRGAQGLASPRSGGLRLVASGTSGRGESLSSTGGWALTSPDGTGGLAVAGEVAAADAAASASVADAAVEAAAVAAGAAAAASGATAAAAAPAPSSSLYDYFFGSTSTNTSAARISSTRLANTDGSPGASAAPAAALVATTLSAPHSGLVLADSGMPAAPPVSIRAEGAAFSLPMRSPMSAASDGALSTPSAGPMRGPSASVTVAATCPAANSGANSASSAAAGPAIHEAAGNTVAAASECRDGGAAAGAVDASLVVQPAALLVALLQDLQDRCGLLHLGLTAVYDGGAGGGRGGAGEDCGLVASWRREVAGVVEPGPESDRILSELGYQPGSAAPSLTSLFTAVKGGSLEASRCSSYRLLARQEVWHQGAPLATLLLQVTRPNSLLRPTDLLTMAPQLSGLVVTSAAPLPPAVTAALLQAGAAAVICPNTPLLPATPSVLPHTPRAGLVATSTSGVGGSMPATPASGPAPFMILPASAGGPHQARSQLPQPPQASLVGVNPLGSTQNAPRVVEAAVLGLETVTGFFEVLVDELVAGATVVGSIAAAERQHAALRGRVLFHHL